MSKFKYQKVFMMEWIRGGKINMTGRDLLDGMRYLGMERAVRKLALEEKLESADNIAVMSTLEVCELISKTYEMVYNESEEIGLVRKDMTKEYNKLVKVIGR